MRDAIVFAIFDCGFVPRCALEANGGHDVRFDKIQRLIGQSKFGIHDISCTELDAITRLPRFNMPLELGVFLAARRFGDKRQKQKSCLILDRAPYRYREFISDISGHDISAHTDDPFEAIRCVRDWLRGASNRKIPGGKAIADRYRQFRADLPATCAAINSNPGELTYIDYTNVVSQWLKST
jgi:hypothetical protein